MKKIETIKSYNARTFNDTFLEKNLKAASLFKDRYEFFFCLKLEDFVFKSAVPPSRSVCHTIIFITSGSYKCKVGLEEYRIQQNEMLVIAAGQIFSIEQSEPAIKGIICHFNLDILIGKYGNKKMLNQFEFLKVWGNAYMTPRKQEAEFIFNLISRLQIEYAGNGTANPDIIQPYLIALLCEIHSNYKATTSPHLTAAAMLVTRFKELIYTHVKTAHEVGLYASRLNVTPNHLNKSVKLVTGKSPVKWINETIVTEAKYLLYQTTLSISEISTEVGHVDPSYFSRLFKKQAGITPLEYRKMIEKSG